MISSLRSAGAWEASASEVSQNPSRWMPPESRTGIAVATAAVSPGPTPKRRQSHSQQNSAAPITTPISGKKQKA